MMCLALPGTLMPQSKVVRDSDRSCRPPRTKLATSFMRSFGSTKSGTRVVELEKLVGIGGEPEEIALLLDPFDRRVVGPEALALVVEAGLALVVIGFVAHRIPAGIFVEIDVAGLLHALPRSPPTNAKCRGSVVRMKSSLEISNLFTMAWKRGTLRSTSCRGVKFLLGRGLQHFAAVLVGAGEKEHVAAVEAGKAGDGVGGDRLIGVADMRRAVRIGNRGGDVIGLGGHDVAVAHDSLCHAPRRRGIQ